jgi:NTE family protein
MRFIVLIILVFVSSHLTWGQQRVGLVLSGGGAAGFAHIGVIKALEEHNIPIDYITGTSAGALVGGLYASGLSIQQIEAISTSEQFYLMVNGETERRYKYNLRREPQSASMVSLPFSKDSILYKSLPISFITPALFDFEMLKIFGVTSASRFQNFDSLFVPFRCVAADIKSKREYIFRSGHLNHAIRASMTFPLYVNPIRVDGILLFDGGLYNNFPADLMYEDFSPDFIIGSNVSENSIEPGEDDLFSQMKAAMVRETKFEIPCNYGLIIKHDLDIGTFSFDRAKEAIQIGYNNTIKMIDSLRLYIYAERSVDALNERRSVFLQKIVPIKVSSASSFFDGGKRAPFINYPLQKKLVRRNFNETKLKKYYFQLYGTPEIRYVLPELTLKDDSTYHLNLKVKKTKDFSLDVGGHFSSRPVNIGYVGLSYYYINRLAWRAHVESYFGKFYSSGKVRLDLHIPSQLPFVLSPYFVLNRWDYFKSFATFFEPVRPSFLVQEEMYTGAKISFPLAMTVRAGLDYRNFSLTDRYYQTNNFTIADTADLTNFFGNSFCFTVDHNTLNRKQFPSEGSSFNLSLRYIRGMEHTITGSTALVPFNGYKDHEWINLQIEARKFFNVKRKYAIGIHGLGVFNSQSLFQNYVSSILALTEFSPIPDARTFFMAEYRTPQYIAGGVNQIANLFNRLELHFDAYAFQPIVVLRTFDQGGFGYSQYQLTPKFMGSASLIFQSPIGPFRATVNYFPEQKSPFIFLLSFGYVLFNERAIR